MLKSKTTDIGGGYRILEQLVERPYGNWTDYTLLKGDKAIAWCTKAHGGKVSEVYTNGTTDEYREYLRANLWRYPFDAPRFDDYLLPAISLTGVI